MNNLTPEEEIQLAQQQIEQQARKDREEPVILPNSSNFQTNEKLKV